MPVVPTSENSQVLSHVARLLGQGELRLMVMSAILGAAVGAMTLALQFLIQASHIFVFALPPSAHLSADTQIDAWRMALLPAMGGLVFGLLVRVVEARRPAEIVDPVEANALYGGRMSLRDSMRLTGYSVVSNASGASIGMEAGLAQLGSGVFSSVGRRLALAREDQRIMVTAGSAAAIAAAFNAPIAGAFYGFELTHGGYTTRLLAPVTTAAMSSAVVVRLMGQAQTVFAVPGGYEVPTLEYALFLIMGLLCALVGIASMRLATSVERVLNRVSPPRWIRPAIGGLCVGLLGVWIGPQVLGSGHGALQHNLDESATVGLVALILAGKIAASAVSLGTGFRGGLFSSSLLIGALLGALVVSGISVIDSRFLGQREAFMLVAMGGVGAAIVGAPLAMVFLILELTGDFPVTLGVLVCVVVSATTVRLTFGYSFSTWRFHLRGLPLRGGHDVGWISELTAQSLARGDPILIAPTLPLRDLRLTVPVGSRKWVFAVGTDQSFQGMVDMIAAHDPDLTDIADHLLAADLLIGADAFVTPRDNIQQILQAFADKRVDTLAVVESPDRRRIVGYLTEAYCLKRYSQELERRRRDELGLAGM